MPLATVEEILSSLPMDRQPSLNRLVDLLDAHLPPGFERTVAYGMISWVVPLSTFPAGYHCTPGSPLPFLSIASQKRYISVYHMGLYADPDLMTWFKAEFPRHSPKKLDMGKSCIRFKKPEDIPWDLLGDLASRMTPERWVALRATAAGSPRPP